MVRPRPTTKKKCLECSGVFYPAISEVKRGNGKFCSLSCVGHYCNKHYIKPRPAAIKVIFCKFCGKKFEYRIRKHPKYSLRKFCSYACANNAKRGKQPGHLNQNVRRKLKEIAFSTYGEQCEVCGYRLSVDVHHLIPRSENGRGEVYNLAVLCPNHHREVHIGILSRNDIFKIRKLTIQNRVEAEGSGPSSEIKP